MLMKSQERTTAAAEESAIINGFSNYFIFLKHTKDAINTIN